MISLKPEINSNNKNLSIITASTNKALLEVVKNLSSSQLQNISLTKDLPTLLNTLLKESLSSKQEGQSRALLQLLQTNPTLKDLANTTATIKSLQTILLQTEFPSKEATQTFKNLQTSLTKLQGSDNLNNADSLQKKLQNSGIFLESKLKNFTPPLKELQTQLTQLNQKLQQSEISVVQKAAAFLKGLSSAELFSQTTKNFDSIPNKQLFQNLATTIQTLQKTAQLPIEKSLHPQDILFNKEIQQTLNKIDTQLKNPQQLQEKKQFQEVFQEDLKVNLLQAKEELNKSDLPYKTELLKHIEKLQLQIDYYQMLSHLSNSSALFIPYSFDALKEGKIKLKKSKKGAYFCDIELLLKEYGELTIRLGLFDENELNININCQSEKLHELLTQELPKLKKNLFEAGLYPKDIRFIQQEPLEHYTNTNNEINLGFEAKV